MPAAPISLKTRVQSSQLAWSEEMPWNESITNTIILHNKVLLGWCQIRKLLYLSYLPDMTRFSLAEYKSFPQSLLLGSKKTDMQNSIPDTTGLRPTKCSAKHALFLSFGPEKDIILHVPPKQGHHVLGSQVWSLLFGAHQQHLHFKRS